jgi:hypothetical protein
MKQQTIKYDFEFIGKEQIPQEEKTRYWFKMLENMEMFAVVHQNNSKFIIDSQGYPVNTEDIYNAHLVELFNLVTEKMILE